MQTDDISWRNLLLLTDILQGCLSRLEPFRMWDEIVPVPAALLLLLVFVWQTPAFNALAMSFVPYLITIKEN
jgi:hypothetical protein